MTFLSYPVFLASHLAPRCFVFFFPSRRGAKIFCLHPERRLCKTVNPHLISSGMEQSLICQQQSALTALKKRGGKCCFIEDAGLQPHRTEPIRWCLPVFPLSPEHFDPDAAGHQRHLVLVLPLSSHPCEVSGKNVPAEWAGANEVMSGKLETDSAHGCFWCFCSL